MPILPTNIPGDPDTDVYSVPFAAVGTAGNDLTTEVAVVARTGYLTSAKLIPVGAATADATDKRTWSIQDVTTRAPTDGCIVDPANALGPWNSATAYTSGKSVILNNLMYVCISSVTGGTGPGVDTSHWQQIAAMGLGWVNTVTGAFTADDVGKAISDSGNTDIPATSFIGAVVSAVSGTASAAAIVSVAPTAPAGNSPTAAQSQATQGVVPNQVNGVAAVTRTFTIGSSRTALATFTCSTVSLAAGTSQALALSSTDTKVFAGDVVKLVSTHVGAGVADPGGELQLVVTAVGEGSN
jgi:hypothetical protein